MSNVPPPQLEAARKLAPLIRASADEIDAVRELPKPLFCAIADAGLFHMGVPRAIGGLEVELPTYVQVIDNGEVRLRDGKPETRFLLVPAAQVELLDTWHVRGMRGTGTNHFVVTDVFVPEERTVLTAGGPLVTDGPLYRIPRTLAFGSGDSSVALGMARSCLDVFFELAGSKAPRHMQGLLRDQAMTQFSVGQAEATLRSSHAFLMESVSNIWDEVTSTGEVSLERRVSLRLAITHGIRQAAQIIESIYSLSGADAVFEGNLIQRYFQDIHVITQHLQSRLAHYELIGKYWLGLPVEETRF